MPSFMSTYFCWFLPSSELRAISPFELITRCQGRPYFSVDEFNVQATCLAALGLPANFAILPYVRTFPLGMLFIRRIILLVNSLGIEIHL